MKVQGVITVDKKQLLSEIGERLTSRRKFLNLTQEQAAEKANVHQQSISDAENGKTGLMPDTLLKICRAYQVSADFILTGEITNNDIMILNKRVQQLPPDKFQHLQGIINHYIEAVMPE